MTRSVVCAVALAGAVLDYLLTVEAGSGRGREERQRFKVQ